MWMEMNHLRMHLLFHVVEFGRLYVTVQEKR